MERVGGHVVKLKEPAPILSDRFRNPAMSVIY